MRFKTILTCAAVAAFVSGVSAASAQDQVASVSSCLKLSDQVKTALQNGQQSANYDSAKKEGRYGLEYCNNAFYAQGIQHYERALQLLGVAPQGMAQQGS